MAIVIIVSIISVLGIMAVAVLALRHVLGAWLALILGVLVASLLLGLYFWVRDGGGVHSPSGAGALAALVDGALASLREALTGLFGFLF